MSQDEEQQQVPQHNSLSSSNEEDTRSNNHQQNHGDPPQIAARGNNNNNDNNAENEDTFLLTMIIETPNEHDVLLGRGRPMQTHPGNLRLTQSIQKYRRQYQDAPRNKRMKIANQILYAVKNHPVHPSRFLKNIGPNQWIEVDDNIAGKKISHGLREKNPKTMKKVPAAAAAQPYNNLLLEDHSNQEDVLSVSSATSSGGSLSVTRTFNNMNTATERSEESLPNQDQEVRGTRSANNYSYATVPPRNTTTVPEELLSNLLLQANARAQRQSQDTDTCHENDVTVCANPGVTREVPPVTTSGVNHEMMILPGPTRRSQEGEAMGNIVQRSSSHGLFVTPEAVQSVRLLSGNQIPQSTRTIHSNEGQASLLVQSPADARASASASSTNTSSHPQEASSGSSLTPELIHFLLQLETDDNNNES